MALTLKSSITGTGINQGDLVDLLTNIIAVVNELQTDHATARTELVAIGTTLASVKTKFDAHTHESPGTTYAASRGSTPDTGAAENSLAASAASAVADTSGSSVPATLTNSTALTMSKG